MSKLLKGLQCVLEHVLFGKNREALPCVLGGVAFGVVVELTGAHILPTPSFCRNVGFMDRWVQGAGFDRTLRLQAAVRERARPRRSVVVQ